MRSLLCGRYPLALRSLCADVPGLLCAACAVDPSEQTARSGDARGHRALSRCADSAVGFGTNSKNFGGTE